MSRLKRNVVAASQLPQNIVRQLSEYYDDDEIAMMSKNEAFSALLNCEGIMNYDYKIKNWVEQIYGVKLD